MRWKPIKEDVIEIRYNKRKGIRLKAIHHEGRKYVGCLACDLFRACHKNKKGVIFICRSLNYPEHTTFKKYEDSKEEG